MTTPTTIGDYTQLTRMRSASVKEVIAAVLARIDADSTGAFSYVDPEAALRRAEELDRSPTPSLPLFGVPVGIKDLFDVPGMPTSYACRAYEPSPAHREAGAVARLTKAGAVVVGKTRTAELAWSSVTQGVANPHDASRISGGSSGGSAAAVGASLVPVALGTDTAGSIRIPASICGVVGYKPTYGTVSRAGLLPANFSLDHAGPLCRSAEDAHVLARVLIGPDARDPMMAPARHLSSARADLSQAPGSAKLPDKVGVLEGRLFEIIDPEVRAAYEGALARLASAGVELQPLSVPHDEFVGSCLFAIDLPEGAAIHTEALRTRRERIDPEIAALLSFGHRLPGSLYARAHRVRRVIGAAVAREFADSGVEIALAPANPALALPWSELSRRAGADPASEPVMWSYTRVCWLANLTGQPAVSVPIAGTNLPTGLQLIGRPFEDGTLLKAAIGVEEALR